MNRLLLSKHLHQAKELCNLNFVITETSDYGDCVHCVKEMISQVHGEDAKGVFIKFWDKGAFSEKSFEDISEIEIEKINFTERENVLLANYLANFYQVLSMSLNTEPFFIYERAIEVA